VERPVPALITNSRGILAASLGAKYAAIADVERVRNRIMA